MTEEKVDILELPLATEDQLEKGADQIAISWGQVIGYIDTHPVAPEAVEIIKHLEVLTQSCIATVNELRKIAYLRDKPRVQLINKH